MSGRRSARTLGEGGGLLLVSSAAPDQLRAASRLPIKRSATVKCPGFGNDAMLADTTGDGQLDTLILDTKGSAAGSNPTTYHGASLR